MPTAPERILADGGHGAISTFVREWTHPKDRTVGVSAEAVERFELDSRRFPPFSYEAGNLLWKEWKWRQPHPRKRAAMMGLPAGITNPLCEHIRDPKKMTAVANSLIGN